MRYTDLLAYWRKELSDPTATGHDWTPEEIEEQAIRQLVYSEVYDFVESDPPALDELLLTDENGWGLDDYINKFVDRAP